MSYQEHAAPTAGDGEVPGEGRAIGLHWSRRFGHIVRAQREARRWSQESLAHRADLNRSYLGEIERGDCMPSLATMAKIALALDARLSTLLAQCEGGVEAGLDAGLDARAQPAA
jgi:transcriptional regulator with XRE-family HTH domain